MIIKDRVVLFICPQIGIYLVEKVTECANTLQLTCTNDVLFSTTIICLPDKFAEYCINHENVVTPLWIIRSLISNTLLPLEYFSSNPSKFLSGRIICFERNNFNGEIIQSYKSVIKHLGGLVIDYSCRSTCTDVICTSENCNTRISLKSNLVNEPINYETLEFLDEIILQNLYNCLHLRSITHSKSLISFHSLPKTDYISLSWLRACIQENCLVIKSRFLKYEVINKFDDNLVSDCRNFQNYYIIYSSRRYIKKTTTNKFQDSNRLIFEKILFHICPCIIESQKYSNLCEIIIKNGGTIISNDNVNTHKMNTLQLTIFVSDFITPTLYGLIIKKLSDNTKNIRNKCAKLSDVDNINGYKLVTQEYVFDCVRKNELLQLKFPVSRKYDCTRSYINDLLEQFLYKPAPISIKRCMEMCYVSIIENHQLLKLKYIKILNLCGACYIKTVTHGLCSHIITATTSCNFKTNIVFNWSNVHIVSVHWVLFNFNCCSLQPTTKYALKINAVNEKIYLLGGGEKLRKETKFKNVITRLGGNVVWPIKNMYDNCTHLILNNTSSRTEKFLCACAAGLWILNSKYIEDCEITNKLLPEETYEYLSENLLAACCRRWRLSPVKPFEMMKIILLGQTTPPVDTLMRIIQAGKGVAQDFNSIESLFSDLRIFYFADFIICGDDINISELMSNMIHLNTIIFHRLLFVRASFILDMITVNPLPEIKEYLLW